MTIFNVPDSGPTAADLARGFLLEANAVYKEEHDKAEDLIQRFWFRNGYPALSGDEPTGIEILQAAGTDAEKLYTMAVARVQMLLSIEPSEVNLATVSGPYDLTFNPDGSLGSYTER